MLSFQHEKAVSISESAEVATSKARKTQFDPGKTAVVKRRATRPIIDDDEVEVLWGK